MVLVKILGGIDLIASITFLMIIFSINPPLALILFSSGLLFLKGLFVFTGEPLSAIDLVSSVILLLSLVFSISSFLLWIPALLLLAKGFVSFV